MTVASILVIARSSRRRGNLVSPHDSARLLRYARNDEVGKARNDEVEKACNDGMGKGAPEGAPPTLSVNGAGFRTRPLLLTVIARSRRRRGNLVSPHDSGLNTGHCEEQ